MTDIIIPITPAVVNGTSPMMRQKNISRLVILNLKGAAKIFPSIHYYPHCSILYTSKFRASGMLKNYFSVVILKPEAKNLDPVFQFAAGFFAAGLFVGLSALAQGAGPRAKALWNGMTFLRLFQQPADYQQGS
ncbi:MAG: hypothetical protein ACNS63_02020 [Candidatus Nitrospinota bacterium M3_3B_026]